ncbi:unnamed protein product [Adineta steineri]|uniref:Uncharacterized protein n=1 Tax=Adineta steineri TaxID=433720 RepID=A0A815RAB4_9BILA|nr:unnamed protein product [Adineta steineri]
MARKKIRGQMLQQEKENVKEKNVQVVTSQKRKREEYFDLILDENNSDEFIRLKKKCLDLEKRVEVLESALMPYSDQLDMVENMFDDIVEDTNHDRIVVNDGRKMSDSNNELNLNSEILNGLKQDSSTTTARAILKYLYPRASPNF